MASYLVINGYSCDGLGGTYSIPEPAHGGFSVSIQDVDSASTGRGADGNMIRDRVAIKRKINLKFPPLTTADLNKLLTAVSDVSFSVTCVDPQAGSYSGTFYVGDRTAPIYKTNSTGVDLWESVSFNLIEM